MEFYFLSNTALELKDVKEALMLRKPLLNFDADEFYKLHLAMMILKCIIAGNGLKKIVPMWLTIGVATAYVCGKCIWPSEWKEVAFAFFLVLVCAFWRMSTDSLIFNIPVLLGCSFNFDFKILLDLYVVATAVCYIFQIFGEEYEKACALLCYFYCLNYWIGYFIGQDKINMYNTLATVHIPVLMIVSFSPVKRENRLAFFPIACWTAAFLTLKLIKLYMINGVVKDVWNPEYLDIEILKNALKFSFNITNIMHSTYTNILG